MAVINDPIADMLTRVRNGLKAGLTDVSMPASRMKAAVAEALIGAGYLTACRVEGEGTGRTLTVVLKYQADRTPVVEGLKRISKPSVRRYVGHDKIPRVLGGFGTVILSTSRGVMTDKEARRERIGGEVLCSVW